MVFGLHANADNLNKTLKDSRAKMLNLNTTIEEMGSKISDSAKFGSASMNMFSDAIRNYASENTRATEGTNEFNIKAQEGMIKAREAVDELAKGFERITGKELGEKQFEALAAMASQKGGIEKLNESFANLNEAIDKADDKKLSSIAEQMDRLSEDDIVNNIEDVASGIGKIAEQSIKIEAAGDRFADFKRKIGSVWDTLTAGARTLTLASVLGDLLSAQDEATRSIVSMGLHYNDSINTTKDGLFDLGNEGTSSLSKVRSATSAFMDTVNVVASTTSKSFTETAQAMAELAAMRIPVGEELKNLESVAITSMRMTDALGMSQGAANEFARSLMVVGDASAEGFEMAAEALVTVRNSMGLTAQEATVVTSQVGRMIRQFSAFGDVGDGAVAMVTEEVGRLVAAFTQVGLEASEASGLIDRMMNVDNINQNVMLWQGLGISMQEGFDVMAGGAGAIDGLSDRMVGLARSLMDQARAAGTSAPFILKQFEQMYGISAQQIRALAGPIAGMTEEERKAADLARASEEARQSAAAQLSKLWANVSVILAKTVMPILEGLNETLKPFIDTLHSINWGAVDSAGAMEYLRGVLDEIAESDAGGFVKMLVSWLIRLSDWLSGKQPLFSGFQKVLAGIALAMVLGLKPIRMAISLFSGLGGILGGIGKRIRGVSDGAGGLFSRMGDGLSKINPGKILAVGAAFLMMGVGIGVVVYSISLLVAAVGEANLTFDQLAGIALIVMGVILGMGLVMVGIIYALGAAGTFAAFGILAVGIAFLLMGAGIALAAVGLSKMIESFSLLTAEQAGAVVKTMGMLALIFGIIAISLTIIAITGFVAVPAILAVGVAFLAASVGALLFGIGVKKAGEGMEALGRGMQLISQHGDAMKMAIQGVKEVMGDGFGREMKRAGRGFGEVFESINTTLEDQVNPFENFADNAIAQIMRIVEAMAMIDGSRITLGQVVTQGISSMIEKIRERRSQRQESRGEIEYSRQLDGIMNHLDAIETNTEESAGALKAIAGLIDNRNGGALKIRVTNQQVNVRVLNTNV